MRRLLAHRDARLFLAGQSLSLLGDTALWLALGLWAKDLTGLELRGRPRDPRASSRRSCSRRSAGCSWTACAGARCCSSLNPLTALALLPLLTVNDAGDVWIIYVVSVAYGASYMLLSAGQSALLATLVPLELLGTANADAADRPRRPAAGRAAGRRRPLHGRRRRRRRDPRRRDVPARHRRAARAQDPRAEARAARRAGSSARSPPAPATSSARLPLRRTGPRAARRAMLVIGFGETLLYELPDALGRDASFVGRADGRPGDRRDRRRAHGHQGHGPHAARSGSPAPGMTILAIGALATADQCAAGRARRQDALRRRPAVDGRSARFTLLQRVDAAALQGRTFAAAELAIAAPQTARSRSARCWSRRRLPGRDRAAGVHRWPRRDLPASRREPSPAR